MLLLIPGPVSTNPRVRAAAAEDYAPWDHSFRDLYARVRARVNTLAGGDTRHTALGLPGCGHFAMEAAIRTFLPPGGRLLLPITGQYADRIGRLATESGRTVIKLPVPQNQHADPASVYQALQADPTITHLACVYSETSTGIIHDVPALAQAAGRANRRVIVDAVSASAPSPFDISALPMVDSVSFTSNKCIEGLPGTSFTIAPIDRLTAAKGNAGSWSFDLAALYAHVLQAGPGSHRFTPAAGTIAAFDTALDIFDAEGGQPARLARYTANMRALYDGVQAIGLSPSLPAALQGPIVVNVEAPPDPAWSLQTFVDGLKSHGFIISNFYNTPTPSFRVGCIGAITPDDMRRAVAAMGTVLADMGIDQRRARLMSDLEIARAATLRPIAEIAARAGIPDSALEPYGKYKAKIALDFVQAPRPQGKLVLVTGISPTAAGEGKTTTTIGLGDALNHIGTKAMICLREPSLGPCFGMKGGATGGGRAQVAPMDEINLHFTGDFHAITSANNLLSALLENHLYWGNELGIDPRRVTWRRCLDMNDRALRSIVSSLGGPTNGSPREDGFDITVASEVMAVFCLAKDLDDLQTRLGRIQVATTRTGAPILARDLQADGAMAALLRDAFAPNLVQTLDGSPALVHGGPFANIAHGCNSVIATNLALGLAEVVVTEAGFGADLGGEKFLDIKCRTAGLAPSAAVIVATIRALKMHGGIAKSGLARPDPEAVTRGLANLARHVENMQKFGLPVIVALNRFTSDTTEEVETVRTALAARGVQTILCTHWSDGAAGAADLARAVLATIQADQARFTPLYPDAMPLAEKLRTIAREIYRADDIAMSPAVTKRLATFEAAGFTNLPVCIAKTQYSFSADPTRMGAPTNHTIPIRDVRLSAGAGFIVAICGDIMTMPGLPRTPAANAIHLNQTGMIEGLF